MKKEIKEMLTLSNENKRLKLNGAFTLEANYGDSHGVNVALSSKEPVNVSLVLVYTLAHDKCLGRSRNINARDCDGIIAEISTTMEDMLNEITSQLVKDFNNGYLLGKVE